MPRSGRKGHWMPAKLKLAPSEQRTMRGGGGGREMGIGKYEGKLANSEDGCQGDEYRAKKENREIQKRQQEDNMLYDPEHRYISDSWMRSNPGAGGAVWGEI